VDGAPRAAGSKPSAPPWNQPRRPTVPPSD
jgi:hypothetical protein